RRKLKTMTPHLLIVDRDREFLQDIQSSLIPRYQTETADTVEAAIEKLDHANFDVVFSGQDVLDSDGCHLIIWTRRHHPITVPIVLTSPDSAEGALVAIREAAFDYLSKPFDLNQFIHTVERALEYRRLAVSEQAARENLDQFLASISHEMRTPLMA